MVYLPSEIIFDVFSRVPAKSLIRFRCVCKSWHSLISDPQFLKTHLHRAITDDNICCLRIFFQTPNIMFKSSFQSIDFKALIYGDNNPSSSSFMADIDRRNGVPISVSGSCNGLVCLVADYDRIIVGNPCTRKFRELPYFSHPLTACLAHGFGYDSSVDDYKVVRTVEHGTTHIDIFSLKGNYWKRVKDIHSSIGRFESGNWVFFDGSLHCIASCWESYRRRWIISFKWATEEFCKLVPLPPEEGAQNCLCVLGGCLSVVCRDRFFNYKIWMMNEYGVEASWTKLLTYPKRGCIYMVLVPLWISKNGELLLDVGGKGLIMYDLKKMTARDIDVPSPLGYYSSASTYIETLVSPN